MEPSELFRTEERDGFLVVTPTPKEGKILAEDTIQGMRAWLLDLIHEPNCRGVLITFKEVGFMSTAMLGPLVTLERGMRLSNRKLVLSNVEEGMRKVMEITRLERVIPIRDNEEQGLEELKRAS